MRGTALGIAGILLVLIGGGLRLQNNAQLLSQREQERQAEAIEIEALHLTVAMDKQQAALRGYAISGDPQFLVPYQQGRQETAQAQAALSHDVRRSGLERTYANLVPAVAAWQSWAESGRARVAAGARAGPSSTYLVEGQRLFNTFNERDDELNRGAAQRSAQIDAQTRQTLQTMNVVAIATVVFGVILLGALLVLLLRFVLQPLTGLSRAAESLAAGVRTRIPGIQRRDEVGVLARSLQEWVEAEGTREAIVEQSPVGICVVGTDGRFLRGNARFTELTGFTADQIPTLTNLDVIRPEEREAALEQYRQLARGQLPVLRQEIPHLRRDGSWFWASVIVAPVHSADGLVTCFVAMVRDITARREQLARAEGIQRGLLPQEAPQLDGYELAGACRSAQEVGGDFFDWYQSRPNELTLSLGDVMGKGVPAAILMATARAALRTGARLPSIDDSAQVATGALAADLEPLGSFVTLFHARLDELTGVVSFVDAGHGLAAVVHADGSAERVGGTDFPVGVEAGHHYAGSRITLQPGDALVVFSDGILDVHPELEGSLDRVGPLVTGTQTAGEMVDRLLSGSSEAPADDETVVVLRRRAQQPVAATSQAPERQSQEAT